MLISQILEYTKMLLCPMCNICTRPSPVKTWIQVPTQTISLDLISLPQVSWRSRTILSRRWYHLLLLNHCISPSILNDWTSDSPEIHCISSSQNTCVCIRHLSGLSFHWNVISFKQPWRDIKEEQRREKVQCRVTEVSSTRKTRIAKWRKHQIRGGCLSFFVTEKKKKDIGIIR